MTELVLEGLRCARALKLLLLSHCPLTSWLASCCPLKPQLPSHCPWKLRYPSYWPSSSGCSMATESCQHCESCHFSCTSVTEAVGMSHFSRWSSQPKDRTQCTYIDRWILYHLAMRETWYKCEWVSEVSQSCLILCDPMDCSLTGSSLCGIFQARILEWVAISFSRRSSRLRDWTQVSGIVVRHFTIWATREVTSYIHICIYALF